MEKRKFGNTGLETSLIGFGGFHLCEIPYAQADKLLNRYLDLGGNYIETAAGYGEGESEIKIGRAVSHRRSEFILATKAHARDAEGCKLSIEKSLRNLQTDFTDVLFMHAVGTKAQLDQILGEGGAIHAAEAAKAAGQVKHIGISMHGQPDVLIDALKRYPFEVVMTTINYFDDCNFPTILSELVPLAHEKGCAVVLMKAFGDGYLYKSPEPAMRFALNQDVAIVVAGTNTMEMLEKDIAMAEAFVPMTAEEEAQLILEAPELGQYVCRQCGKCLPCPEGIDIPKVFLIEGIFDRQMGDGDVADAGFYALKERLKFWFQGQERAVQDYAQLDKDAKACTGCGDCVKRCPYGIDIISKLKNVDYKLDKKPGKIYE